MTGDLASVTEDLFIYSSSSFYEVWNQFIETHEGVRHHLSLLAASYSE